MNGSHRWRCAAQADQEHLTAHTGYNSPPLRLSRVGWAGTAKPANRGATEGPESSPQSLWRSKGQPISAPGKRATERHSMEYPKRLDEAEARTKSAFRNRKTHVSCPEELHWAPTKFWRTRETTQEGWPTGQDPRTTRNYADSVRTQEKVRTRHFRTRTLRTELQSLKGRDGQTLTQCRGDIHAKRKGCRLEQRPYRYAKNRSHDLMPGRGVRQRIWGTLNIHRQPIPRSPTSGRAASKPPCVEDQRMKTPRWKGSPRSRRSRPIPRGGREATGPEEGQNPLLRWLEGYTPSPRQKRRQQNVEPTLLQSRPADQRVTQRHPEDGRKKHSQEPNCSNSFIRDQIDRSRPDRGDPILKEYRQDIQSRLRYDRVGEKHTRPAGWPHREATKDRWTEEDFVSIECAEMCHTTQHGWPHREG